MPEATGGEGPRDPMARRAAAALTLGGLLAAAVGSYGLLDPSAPVALGVPALALGLLALAGALLLGGRRSVRSRYRPDRWALPEWLTIAAGVAMVAGIVVAGRSGAVLEPSVQPLEWPTLPLVAAAGILAGLLPAWCTPRPPSLSTVTDSSGADTPRRRPGTTRPADAPTPPPLVEAAP